MSSRTDINNAASRFKHRIRLERPVISQDSIGDTLTTWVHEANVWADIQSRSGSEEFRHRTLSQVVTHDITIRYREAISPTWRIVFSGRIMQIHSIINVDELSETLLLRAEEK